MQQPRRSQRSFARGFGRGLPLHVRRIVGTATREGDDVIDDVARPAVRVAGHLFELEVDLAKDAEDALEDKVGGELGLLFAQ